MSKNHDELGVVEGVVEKLMSRRGFLKTGGAAVGTVVLSGVVAGCGDDVTRIVSADGTGTNPGTSSGAMTLEEMNDVRTKMIASKTDYTFSDGTVIPAVYVKLRALINSYGLGWGAEAKNIDGTENKNFFAEVMYLFSTEDAQAYLEMPMAVFFTASDFALLSGRTEESCGTICEDMSKRSLLFRELRSGVPYYHQLAVVHGIYELMEPKFTPEYLAAHHLAVGQDHVSHCFDAETPFFYTVPANKEIVTTGDVYTYDDWEANIRRSAVVVLANCQCTHDHEILGDVSADVVNRFPMERCIATGSLAEYMLYIGMGREVTQDEAIAIVRKNVELGLTIQQQYNKRGANICACHSSTCQILGGIKLIFQLQDGVIGNAMANYSHYTLEYDKSKCIHCGKCEQRCTMVAITMKDGTPVVNGSCVKCGQCGVTCPGKARKLEIKKEFPELPETMLDDYNLKAAYRMNKGWIK